MMITRGHRMAQRGGGYARRFFERKWREHMEEVRQFEGIRLRTEHEADFGNDLWNGGERMN